MPKLIRHENNVVWFRRHKFRVFWVPHFSFVFTHSVYDKSCAFVYLKLWLWPQMVRYFYSVLSEAMLIEEEAAVCAED